MATRKSEVSEVFEDRIRDLRTAAGAGIEALKAGDWSKVVWSRPVADNWDGDLFDLTGLAAPFNRDQLNDWFTEAHNNSSDPGVTGDAVITQLQAAYLGAAERAFRARHSMRRPRAFAHALARRAGHGHASGAFTQTLEFVRALVRSASPETTT